MGEAQESCEEGCWVASSSARSHPAVVTRSNFECSASQQSLGRWKINLPNGLQKTKGRQLLAGLGGHGITQSQHDIGWLKNAG
jgi:hypothetical protein